jgi:hypothetical protein
MNSTVMLHFRSAWQMLPNRRQNWSGKRHNEYAGAMPTGRLQLPSGEVLLSGCAEKGPLYPPTCCSCGNSSDESDRALG